MKKRSVRTLIGIITLVLLTCSMLPVDIDAGACSGGFRRYITDMYIGKLYNIVINNLGEEYTIISTAQDVSETVEWDGRKIKCSVQYEIEGRVSTGAVVIDFVGTRYWFEKYLWRVDDKVA